MLSSSNEGFDLRVLVTGFTGFAGRFLTHHLAAQGLEIFGLARRVGNFAEFHPQPADLLDPTALRAILCEIHPDQIYHLAAFTDAGGSFRDARRVWDANL